jgi:hypothetical protein
MSGSLLARVAATPLVGAAISRGRHRGVVACDARDGRWPHVRPVDDPISDGDTDAIALLPIAHPPDVRFAIALGV